MSIRSANLEPLHPPAAEIERRLRKAYGRPNHYNKRNALSELIFIILSTQTREAEYRRTFSLLWSTYRSWDRVRTAPSEEIESLIRFGGFARRKVGLIQALLHRVHADRGITSLRFLRALPDEEALAYLVSLPAVGQKTARCVLMYSLERSVLPVDTHVWRISKRLGWVRGPKNPTDAACNELERRVAPPLRHSLHVTMLALGREICRLRPRCESCPLATICPKLEAADWSEPHVATNTTTR